MELHPIPNNEIDRQLALEKYSILDSGTEKEFDDFVQVASFICETPISLISLIDKNRQWFKAKNGLEVTETPREYAFCAHAITDQNDIFEVEDATKDKRFFNNPLVTGNLNVKFYAGAVLKNREGYNLGTLCVIDNKPRKLSKEQKNILRVLSRQVINQIEIRKESTEIKLQKEELEIILDNTNELIYELDENGYFLFANNFARKAFAAYNKKLIGSSFLDCVEPKDAIEVSNDFSRLLGGKIKVAKNEFEIINLDGKRITLSQTLKVIKDQEKFVKLVGVSRDITEEKKSTELYKRLSIVAQQTTNIVIIMNKSFEIQWTNQAFTDAFGYQFDEVKGKIPGDILNGPKTDVCLMDQMTKKLLKKKSAHFDLINYGKEGVEKWIEKLINPIFDNNGDVINYVAIEQDITDRKKKQQVIETQHKELIHSMEYASRIQHATLPSDQWRKQLFQENFVIYKPKDIISGDFYLAERVHQSNQEYLELYVVADCTGHGVPGAMLSVLCSNLLVEAINDYRVTSSGEALNYAKRRLFDFIQIDGKKKVYDGMDVAFCAIDKLNKTVKFSGANRPLYIYSNGKIRVLKGDRQSIGYSKINEPFTTQSMEYKEGEILYLFSDGLVDQFGGDKDRKFMSKRLKEFIVENGNLPMQQQKKKLLRAFNDWKGTNEQTDDVCFMAVKL